MLGFVWRYFWVMDDAFIYFRYADNYLFLKRGLVFNMGEYVEAFTSPAWMLLLLPLRGLEFDFWNIVRGLSLVTALGYGIALVAVNRALKPADTPSINLPLALAATHYGITEHFSSGLETPLVQLSAVLLALWLLRPSSVALAICAGLAPLMRPELALVAGICAAAVWLSGRRFPLAFVIAALVANGAWLGFRVTYYADFLPNTYYLKGQPNWMQGYWYLASGVVGQYWIWVLPLGWFAAWSKARTRSREQNIAVVAMLVCAAVLLLWVARIGGDMLYQRFLAAPFTFLLCALGGLSESWVISKPAQRQFAVSVAVVLGAMILSGFSYPPTLSGHPLTAPKTYHYHRIADAEWHRQHRSLQQPENAWEANRAKLRAYSALNDRDRWQPRVLDHPWCKRGFNEYKTYVINSYGLTDAILARIDAPFMRPGHKAVDQHAASLAKLVRGAKGKRGAGMFRRAVEAKKAPKWVVRNLDAIEAIERKVYNRHDFMENLRVALTPIPRLKPR